MKTILRILLLLSPAAASAVSDPANHDEPPVNAPFLRGEDSLCIHDWWKHPANEITDIKVPRDRVVCFGIYTVHNRILKLTAQLYSLFPKETREVRLDIQKDGAWTQIIRHRQQLLWPLVVARGSKTRCESHRWIILTVDQRLSRWLHNKITMLDYANPEKRQRDIAGIKPGDTSNADADWAAGYGLIRFHKKSDEVAFGCWPHFADVTKLGARQFPGWPQTVKP